VLTVFTVVNCAVVEMSVFYSFGCNVQSDIVAVNDCLVVALSVFCTCILSWSTDSLKSIQMTC